MRQVFIGRGPDIADELAFERKLYVIRKRADNEIRTSTLRRRRVLVRLPSLSCKTIVYKGMLLADAARRSTSPTCRPGDGDRRWRWCTRASAPTPSPAGTARTRTATSPTTARSTRCAATSTGCTPARRCSSPSCSATTSRRSCPIINAERQRLGRCSTTCSSCSCSAGRSLPHAMMMMIPEPWSKHESMEPRRSAPSTSTTPA